MKGTRRISFKLCKSVITALVLCLSLLLSSCNEIIPTPGENYEVSESFPNSGGARDSGNNQNETDDELDFADDSLWANDDIKMDSKSDDISLMSVDNKEIKVESGAGGGVSQFFKIESNKDWRPEKDVSWLKINRTEYEENAISRLFGDNINGKFNVTIDPLYGEELRRGTITVRDSDQYLLATIIITQLPVNRATISAKIVNDKLQISGKYTHGTRFIWVTVADITNGDNGDSNPKVLNETLANASVGEYWLSAEHEPTVEKGRKYKIGVMTTDNSSVEKWIFMEQLIAGLDGIIKFYDQEDSRWGKKIYSNHGDANQTIGSSGCGPTTMAMIISTHIRENVTPDIIAKFSVENGYRTTNDGSSNALAGASAKAYGLSCYNVSINRTNIEKALNNGALLYVGVNRGMLTNGTHIVAITGYGAENDMNYFSVYDPNYAKNAKRYTINGIQDKGNGKILVPANALVNEMNCVYAISK